MKRTALVLVTSALLFGCATVPEKKIGPVIFYPSLPQRPRLQFLHSITDEEDLGKPQSAFSRFLLGEIQSQKNIGRPYDVGSSKGKIYILDRAYKKILILDLAAKTFGYIVDERLGALNDPSGIWIAEDETKYVADMKRKQIVVFGKDNKFLRTYGDKDLFGKPVDVAVHENTVYVCDMDKSQIFVLDKDTGRLKSTIGELGGEEGQLYKPTHVVVDREGNIYVNDAFNFRIQKFDPNGASLGVFGYQGDALGAFARPKGFDVDREGYLFVVDAAFENVQIFDMSAKLLLFFGGPGTGPGGMYLPVGLHIDYDNVQYFAKFADKDFRLKYVLYVANMFGQNKLNVYGFGEWIGQTLPEGKHDGADEGSEGKEVD